MSPALFNIVLESVIGEHLVNSDSYVRMLGDFFQPRLTELIQNNMRKI